MEKIKAGTRFNVVAETYSEDKVCYILMLFINSKS